MSRPRIFYSVFIIALMAGSVVLRIGHYLPNVAPITAIALLGGATLTMPWAVAVPLVTMLVSDAIIGFDSLPITLSIYGSFALMVVMGQWLKRSASPWKILTASLGSSTLFYLITNAAVWKFSVMYPQSLDGLWLSYYYALPFFRNTLLGDMMFTFSLFLAVQYVPVLWRRYKPASAPMLVKSGNGMSHVE